MDEALGIVDRERIDRGLSGIAPDSDAEMMGVISSLIHEISMVRHYIEENDFEKAFAVLNKVKEEVPTNEKITSSRLNLEFEKLKFEIAHVTADYLIASGDTTGAIDAYKESIQQAKIIDELLIERRYEPIIIMAYAAFLVKVNPDRMLEQLLPLAKTALGKNASLEGVNLKRQLAEFYRNTGDDYSADDTLTELRQDLVNLGYVDSETTTYIDILPTWIEVTMANESQFVDRLRSLSNVLVAYVSINSLQLRGSNGNEGDKARMDGIVSLFHELRRLENKTHRENALLIEDFRKNGI